jgi:hypothetical protein
MVVCGLRLCFFSSKVSIDKVSSLRHKVLTSDHESGGEFRILEQVHIGWPFFVFLQLPCNVFQIADVSTILLLLTNLSPKNFCFRRKTLGFS